MACCDWLTFNRIFMQVFALVWNGWILIGLISGYQFWAQSPYDSDMKFATGTLAYALAVVICVVMMTLGWIAAEQEDTRLVLIYGIISLFIGNLIGGIHALIFACQLSQRPTPEAPLVLVVVSPTPPVTNNNPQIQTNQ